jgi:hypothetical protein
MTSQRRNRPALLLALLLLIGMALGAGDREAEASGVTWTPTPAQVDEARAQAMALGAADDPAADGSTQVDPSVWSSNVTSARVLGTDRAHALTWMGTPGAVAGGGDQPVLLVEVTGRFVARNISHPPGAPVLEFTHAQLAIAVDTLDVLDFGLTDTALSLDPVDAASAVSLR